MKGLILKDLYAMGSFYRNTLFSMVIVCGCFGFSLGAEGVTAATAIMCATMVVSTFALDERCGWPGFAAALPVARKESVLAKYAVHVIYCFAGTLMGFVISIVVNMFAEAKKHALITPIAWRSTKVKKKSSTSLPLQTFFNICMHVIESIEDV